MNMYFKDTFIINNEFIFFSVCVTIFFIIIICFLLAYFELKNNKR